ncbi:hypothetical protein IM792_20840 [Mucilaginibacter sp. JRF]|uniref:hypothetical protein n=1 Tax=Mucilaginibacter sp. JRF TaxID=2780088 RepID=UPI00187F91E1|nr:hypothetical protein [Mucilaginibacter sp. JRF]MBE9586909.1 hypothetical protein [Mucilaginibacter sp. JRF]
MAFDNIDTSVISSEASFESKVIYGIQKALRKLAEQTALQGGNLVVKIDGEIKDVPARELLKDLPEEKTTL